MKYIYSTMFHQGALHYTPTECRNVTDKELQDSRNVCDISTFQNIKSQGTIALRRMLEYGPDQCVYCVCFQLECHMTLEEQDPSNRQNTNTSSSEK